MNQEQININEKYFKNSIKKNRKCFFESCNEKAINSHVLQENGILNKISENNKVYEAIFHRYERENPIKFKETGIGQVFTFKGFCNKHDNNFFKPIEVPAFDYTDYRNQLLFAYRASVNETRKKEVCIDYYKTIINSQPENSDFKKLHGIIFYLKLGVEEGKYTRELLLKNINDTSKRTFKFFTFESKSIEFCGSGVYTFETNMEIDFFPPDKTTSIFFNLLPIENKTVLLIGYKNKPLPYFEDLFNNFASYNEAQVLKYISNTLLLQIENWVVSPSYYLSHIKPNEGKIREIINWSQSNQNERIDLDFNLFDELDD